MMEEKTILLKMVEFETGEIIAQANMPIAKLPDSFEVNTQMNIAGQEWSVREAFPVHSKDFIELGTLTLKLSKIEKVDPKEILFTLPTISEEFPPYGENPLFDDFVLKIKPDDWRQNEFFAQASYELIMSELREIEVIKEAHSKMAGEFEVFEHCHLRANIGSPNLTIPFKDLLVYFQVEEVGSLFVEDENQYVKDSFSIKTKNSSFYGLVENGLVTLLGAMQFSEDSYEEIVAFTNEFDLIFVGWVDGEIFGHK